MSNTRKIRLIIDKNKFANKRSGKGCNCGKQTVVNPITENEKIKDKESIDKTIHNEKKLKFL